MPSQRHQSKCAHRTRRVPNSRAGISPTFSLQGEEYAETPEMHYMPYHTVGGTNVCRMRFVIRTAVPPLGLIDEVRDVVRSVDPTLAIAHVQAMEEVVADARAQMAFTMVLLAIASVVALLLGSIGIYGVLAYVVGRRTNEIGVRMALGARASEVSRMLVRQGATVVLVGLAVGLAGAFALTRLMSTILFNVSPTDPATYAAVVSFLFAVALAATYLPARKAASIDPVEALRAD